MTINCDSRHEHEKTTMMKQMIPIILRSLSYPGSRPHTDLGDVDDEDDNDGTMEAPCHGDES